MLYKKEDRKEDKKEDEKDQKINHIYNMSIASIILLSIPILAVSGVSLNYVLNYSHLSEKLETIPNDVNKVIDNISLFKEQIAYITEKVNDINNNINNIVNNFGRF
jgi:DNA anti-recombination protein RmuC